MFLEIHYDDVTTPKGSNKVDYFTKCVNVNSFSTFAP